MIPQNPGGFPWEMSMENVHFLPRGDKKIVAPGLSPVSASRLWKPPWGELYPDAIDLPILGLLEI